ncbi:hypothetical protein QJQ45_021312 [Haematococcus lacustris]|nr:hypothetical protein QJQ45_021312 [Haematococcus lacustris]
MGPIPAASSAIRAGAAAFSPTGSATPTPNASFQPSSSTPNTAAHASSAGPDIAVSGSASPLTLKAKLSAASLTLAARPFVPSALKSTPTASPTPAAAPPCEAKPSGTVEAAVPGSSSNGVTSSSHSTRLGQANSAQAPHVKGLPTAGPEAVAATPGSAAAISAANPATAPAMGQATGGASGGAAAGAGAKNGSAGAGGGGGGGSSSPTAPSDTPAAVRASNSLNSGANSSVTQGGCQVANSQAAGRGEVVLGAEARAKPGRARGLEQGLRQETQASTARQQDLTAVQQLGSVPATLDQGLGPGAAADNERVAGAAGAAWSPAVGSSLAPGATPFTRGGGGSSSSSPVPWAPQGLHGTAPPAPSHGMAWAEVAMGGPLGQAGMGLGPHGGLRTGGHGARGWPGGQGGLPGAGGGLPGGVGLPGSRREVAVRAPGRASLAKQFMGTSLRQQLAADTYAVHAQWPTTPGGPEGLGLLPVRVGVYHSLYPLEEVEGVTPGGPWPRGSSQALGVSTQVYKAISSVDGQAYALRRIHPKQVAPSGELLAAARQAVEVWGCVANHPNLVGLRAVFVSSEIEHVPALFLAHDFHPGKAARAILTQLLCLPLLCPCPSLPAGCTTLAAAHLTPSTTQAGMMALSPPPEATLWSYAVQLAALLRAVHAGGLALKASCLHPTKMLLLPLAQVLLSSLGRLRVSCCGVVDTLSSSLGVEREELHRLQRIDLGALGQLLLTLGCCGLAPPGHPPSLELLASAAVPSSSASGPGSALPGLSLRFTPEFSKLVGALLAAPRGGPLGTARQLVAALAERSLVEVEMLQLAQDALVSDLALECENGRLLRLLVKLGFINERPEGDVDASWAETADRYLLKLFRDFVFHQRAPEGHPAAGGPLLDWGHVLEALNKLDAGVGEKILLLARDESAMLVASYADIKRCVSAAYDDLRSKASAAVARNKLH